MSFFFPVTLKTFLGSLFCAGVFWWIMLKHGNHQGISSFSSQVWSKEIIKGMYTAIFLASFFFEVTKQPHLLESGIFQHSLEVFDLSVDFSKSQKVTRRNIRINNQQHQRFFRWHFGHQLPPRFFSPTFTLPPKLTWNPQNWYPPGN